MIMRFLRLNDVIVVIGLSCLIIYKFMDEEVFFKIILLGGRVVVWLESEIEEWME